MKKKILLIVLPILLVVIGLSTFAFIYFFTDIFKSNEERFIKYFKQNYELLSIVDNSNMREQAKLKKENSYILDGKLKLTVQDKSNTQIINAITEGRHDKEKGRTRFDVNLKNGDMDLLKLSYINSDNVYSIKSDEIYQNYIGFRNSNLKEVAKNLGMTESIIKILPDTIDFEKLFEIGNITEEQKQHIINTYLPIIKNSLTKENFNQLENAEIVVNDVNYKAKIYQISLDEDKLTQIYINCLNTVKEDKIILNLIKEKLIILGIEDENIDESKISEGINKIIENLQKEETNKQNNNGLEIIVYEAKGQLLRTSIKFSDDEIITIDKINENGRLKVAITIPSIENLSGNVNNNSLQVICEKIDSEGNIENNITIIPDRNNKEKSITTNTKIGKIQNNQVSSKSTVIINSDQNGNKVISEYEQNIKISNQIDEIMELKDSNSVIINNYKKEQLEPFFKALLQRVGQVLPNKMSQLGINVNQNITNDSKMLSILEGTSFAIASANGIDLQSTLSTVMIGTGAYIYSSSMEAINTTTLQTDNLKEQVTLAYNSMFTKYAGEQNANTVKSLCDTVRIHNMTSSLEEQILLQFSSAATIKTEPTSNITEASINEIKSKIEAGKDYIVDFGYSSKTGKIVGVGIVEK